MHVGVATSVTYTYKCMHIILILHTVTDQRIVVDSSRAAVSDVFTCILRDMGMVDSVVQEEWCLSSYWDEIRMHVINLLSACIYICMYVCMCVCVCVCVCACVRACVRVCDIIYQCHVIHQYVQCMHTYICISVAFAHL